MLRFFGIRCKFLLFIYTFIFNKYSSPRLLSNERGDHRATFVSPTDNAIKKGRKEHQEGRCCQEGRLCEVHTSSTRKFLRQNSTNKRPLIVCVRYWRNLVASLGKYNSNDIDGVQFVHHRTLRAMIFTSLAHSKVRSACRRWNANYSTKLFQWAAVLICTALHLNGGSRCQEDMSCHRAANGIAVELEGRRASAELHGHCTSRTHQRYLNCHRIT